MCRNDEVATAEGKDGTADEGHVLVEGQHKKLKALERRRLR